MSGPVYFKLPYVPQDAPLYEASLDQQSNWHVKGPGGSQFDYYGGALYQESRFVDTGVTRPELCKAHAEVAAMLCNHAYAEGYARAQLDIRLALGL